MNNELLYTIKVYSGADVIAQMSHLEKKEANYHLKQIKSMVKSDKKIKKISFKKEVER